MVGMVSLEQRRSRRPSVLGVVPGALDVFDRRDRCAWWRDAAGRARRDSAVNSGSPFSARLILQRRAFDAEVADAVDEIRRQIALRRSVAGTSACGSRLLATMRRVDLFAAFAARRPCARPSRTRIFSTGALVRISAPLAARRIGDGIRNRAHAAAHEAPQSAMAAHAAHAVVQQDVGGAGRARTAVGADHAVGGERDLDLFGFEPLVQKIGGALREDLDQRRRSRLRLSPRMRPASFR